MVGLARVGSDTSFYSLFLITNPEETHYAIFNCMASVHSDPDAINTITINDEKYYELTYEPGSVLIKSLVVVREDKLIGKSYKEFVTKGKVPFFINYADMGRVFSQTGKYAGKSIGDTFESLAIPISIIARNPDNINQYYREILNDIDPDKVTPVFVPASSVNFSASSALTKLTGSYFYTGVVSSLCNPTTQTELIDYVLRY